MRFSGNSLALAVWAAAAAATISGCSYAALPHQSQTGLAKSGGQAPTSSESARQRARPIADDSLMVSDAATKDLLYVSDIRTVTVYSYPQGKLEGTLRGFYISEGLCVDKKGDVFVADEGYGRIYEYKHAGRRRIKDLFSGDALGCAVDPTTGNLAVTNQEGQSRSGAGNVAIFTNASGKPKYYVAPGFFQYFFCGYDGAGDLFVDGLKYPGGTGDFVFAELPKGSTVFKEVSLKQYIGWPGGVQWDGRYMAVGDQLAPRVYRFAISGSHGSLVGTTPLDGTTQVTQAWISGATITAPNQTTGHPDDVLLYRYPGGGKAIMRITKGVFGPQGATVSKART